ncbi:AlpA family transcriptional regulator [Pseudomonas berkeleyensis]|uniref:AlpA family transcriptional regulator n=1 Tax=Pseudomonas berkeleyensis TaxID=2726956 RepID=A0A7G5DIH3_9PSED|nr:MULTISPECIES: AlpA family transcriptional regulator [Pseudomonas]QMV61548.1 AlpA family transcriptional regulator [Pseudomonas berkeleyensis]WSO36980.1 AlpA family transcriptional regulator [Pseudomonas berkeleyensis]
MRLIRLKEVMQVTGLARSTVYKYIAEEAFPKPVSLGERCVGWVEDEVQDWVVAKIQERNLAKSAAGRPDRLRLAG